MWVLPLFVVPFLCCALEARSREAMLNTSHQLCEDNDNIKT